MSESQRGDEERRIQGGGDGTIKAYFRLGVIADRLYERAVRQSREDGDLVSHYTDHQDAIYLDGLSTVLDDLCATARYVADRLERLPVKARVNGHPLHSGGDLAHLARKLRLALAPSPESAVENEPPTPEEPA